MSRSNRDQRGRRTNGEIWGRGCFKVADGKVFSDCGGEPVGSPGHKRSAKQEVARQRRREDKKIIKSEIGLA